ncbi:MAG: hypothetical protein KAI83_18245 [Thiomargarita sp.]|nr:hypothetical protein [Thiomargarita sp.]
MEYNALALCVLVSNINFVSPSKKRPKLKRWTPILTLKLSSYPGII